MNHVRDAKAVLISKAAVFAHELATLLNASVTNGIQLKAELAKAPITPAGGGPPEQVAIIGYRPAGGRLFDTGAAVPLTFDKHKTTLWLDLSYKVRLTPTGRLSVRSSFVGIAVAAVPETGDYLVSFDYELDKPDGYPDSHIQVRAASPQWADVLAPGDLLSGVHLPTGHAIFRPTLEDVIEMLVVEKLSIGRTNWLDAVRNSRKEFQKRQLAKLLRSDPDMAETARTVLGSMNLP